MGYRAEACRPLAGSLALANKACLLGMVADTPSGVVTGLVTGDPFKVLWSDNGIDSPELFDPAKGWVNW